MTMNDSFDNDLSAIQFLDLISRSGMNKLTNAEYDMLRTSAEKYLTYQTLFQLLSAKLPYKPGVKEAWERLGDCIMCSDEEADKRRKLEYETESRMIRARIKDQQQKQEKNEERKRVVEAVFRQQHKLQTIADDLHNLLRTLQ